MLYIDILIEDPAWGGEDKWLKLSEKVVAALSAELDIDLTNHEVSIVLSNDAAIKILNAKWRNKDKATDVLSFPAPTLDLDITHQEPKPLGDIILAYETIQKDRAKYNKDLESHMAHIILHGFLHLLGYDHETDEEANIMEGLEISILDRLNIANPYIMP